MAGSRSAWEREQRHIAAELERERRADERARLRVEKELKQALVAERKAIAQRKTEDLEERVQEVQTVLTTGLAVPAVLQLEDLLHKVDASPLDLGELSEPCTATTTWEMVEPPAPSPLSRLVGGGRRYEEQRNAARERYDAYLAEVEHRERLRLARVDELTRQHADAMRRQSDEVQRHNDEIEKLAQGLPARDKAAVETFLRHVLERMPLPGGFPREFEITFSPATEQVLARIALPSYDVAPTDRSYKYYERPDEERVIARPVRERQELYRDIVSQVTLLTMRNTFGADSTVRSVGVNGHVHAIDPATGEWEYRCLISVLAEREEFPREAALGNVAAPACLRRLKAIVSNHPYAVEPIEPILDFDLTKFAFVQGLDAVATLNCCPNLLEMSPTNFEHLVRQLFEAQGAEGWTTTQSNDDGVDAVILNRSNLVGGLAVVQAKRYKPDNVLGPSHYRELAGTMEEKKAGWGVLVTTSRFTAGCEQKARDHGRMQLIDGPKLVWMIQEYTGKEVRIG